MIDIKEFRQYKNLSQIELAEILNVSQSYISAIEKGKKSLANKHIETLYTLYERAEVDKFLMKPAYTAEEFNELHNYYRERLEEKDKQISSLLRLLEKSGPTTPTEDPR